MLGLVLLGAGTLLFLALVSYSPADVPSWLFFSKQGAPEAVTENFIGPVGAVVAGFIYFMLGAAAYLLAVVLIGFGGAKFLSSDLILKKRLWWMAAFILSGACLAGIQPWFLQSWREHFNILGPGGWIGLALGKTVLAGLLGVIGATILLTLFYLASLIFMTGMHPVKFCKAVMVEVPAWFRARREAALEKPAGAMLRRNRALRLYIDRGLSRHHSPAPDQAREHRQVEGRWCRMPPPTWVRREQAF